jgi:CBS domain containing-hemolysin-like protein
MSEARKIEAAASPAPQPDGASAPESPAGLFDRLRALFGLEPASVRDDIEDALDEAGPDADFTPQERAILKNVLALHDVKVEDVMVPRADVVAVQIEAPLSEVLALFRTAGHSRLPVYGDTLDDPRGMVHIRDFVDYLAAAPQFGLAPDEKPPSDPASPPPAPAPFDMSLPLVKANILRPVLFVPPSMPALDLLLKMQAMRTHMALVIDEYGGAYGLVSIEDVVEAIVGDIEDEHDEAETPAIEKTPDGAFVADARVSLEDASAALGDDLSKLADAEDVDTIGGLITTKAGRVPGRGEIITGVGDYEFEILDADPRRVKKVKIYRSAKAQKRLAARRRRAGQASDSQTPTDGGKEA